MNQEVFEETLRKFLRRKPFFPFAVELLVGKVIVVERPSLAMGGGMASFLTEDDIVEFACEDVREIRSIPAEAMPCN